MSTATTAQGWELDGLARIASVRAVADAVLIGQCRADAATIDAAASVLAGAADRLRWRDACRR